MPPVSEVFKPLVEDDVAAPACVQLTSVFIPEAAQFCMAVVTIQAHRFGQLSIQIDPDTHIRICNPTPFFEKKVRQGQRNRISGPIEDLEMESAIRGCPRLIISVEPLELGYDLHQPKIIALINRHEADKASRPRNSLRYEFMIEQHVRTISQRRTRIPRSKSVLLRKNKIRKYWFHGLTRRSTPLLSSILLEISSIENSVVST